MFQVGNIGPKNKKLQERRKKEKIFGMVMPMIWKIIINKILVVLANYYFILEYYSLITKIKDKI